MMARVFEPHTRTNTHTHTNTHTRKQIFGSYDTEVRELEGKSSQANHANHANHANWPGISDGDTLLKRQPPFNYGSVQYEFGMVHATEPESEPGLGLGQAVSIQEENTKEDDDGVSGVDRVSREASSTSPTSGSGSKAGTVFCKRYIVPSLYKRKVPGTFFLRVHANRRFWLTQVRKRGVDVGVRVRVCVCV